MGDSFSFSELNQSIRRLFGLQVDYGRSHLTAN
jgi:hypothetical protein